MNKAKELDRLRHQMLELLHQCKIVLEETPYANPVCLDHLKECLNGAKYQVGLQDIILLLEIEV